MKHYRQILAALTLLVIPAASTIAAHAAEGAQPRVEVAVMPTVKVANGHVEITLPGDESRQVQIFALTGQLVKSVTVHPGTTTIELAAGYYIVKCDRLSQRVIVR